MDTRKFRKEVDARKRHFNGFEKRVLEDIANGKVNNAGEIAVTAAKEMLEAGDYPPPYSHSLTVKEKAYAEAAGLTESEALLQLAEAKEEKERIERLNNNEFLNGTKHGEED